MLCSKLVDEIIQVYRGKKTPKQALDDAAAIWNEVLAKRGVGSLTLEGTYSSNKVH